MPADDEGKPERASGPAESSAPPYSEEALALGFGRDQSSQFRHVEAWKQWMHYSGGAWRRDARLQAMNNVRARVRAAAVDVLERGGDGAVNRARKLASAQTVNAVLNLARSDTRIATTTDAWDRDPMLLATPAGVVDLATGQLQPSSPDLMISRVCRFGPAVAGTRHPVWTRFLKDITGGDGKYLSYLQRLAGYFLTGLTKEHELYFFMARAGTARACSSTRSRQSWETTPSLQVRTSSLRPRPSVTRPNWPRFTALDLLPRLRSIQGAAGGTASSSN